MSLQATAGGVSINAVVVAGKKGLTSAAAGPDGSFGNYLIDDIAGTVAIQGWHYTTVEEPLCVAQPRLATGWVFERTYAQGEDSGTAGRTIDVTVIDQNAVFGIRLITNPDGKRKAETHNQRIDWLLGSNYLSGLIADYGQVDRSHPRPMEEADYRGQYPMDVLNDIAGPINKSFHAYWDADNSAIGLFFANPTTVYATSVLSISNTPGAADDYTVFAPQNAQLVADPSEIVSLVRYKYRNGVVLEGDTDTYDAFFSATATGGPSLGNRGIEVDNERVGLESSARIMADAILEKNTGEINTVTCTITVPATRVGLVDAGQRILVTISHLPDLDTATYLRITRRTVRQSVEANNDYYDVDLEMSNKGLPGNGGGGGTGGFPNPPAASPAIVQSKFDTIGTGSPRPSGSITLDAAPTQGNWLIAGIASRGTGITIDPAEGWSEHPHGQITPGSDFGRMVYREVQAGESAVVVISSVGGTRAEVWEVTGIDGTIDTSSFAEADTVTQPASINAGTLTPTSGMAAAMFMLLVQHNSDFGGNGPTTMSTPSGWTLDGEYEVAVVGEFHPNVQADSRIETSTTGSYATSSTIAGAAFNYAGWGGLALAFTSSVTLNPPVPGQPVLYETVTPASDGLTTTFSTQHPFADGSLHVYVDKVDETGAVTSYDGSCGDFTLGFAPRSWELVEVSYQGR